MKKYGIVVDMQNDFVYGPLGTDEAKAIIPNVKHKLSEWQSEGRRIIFTLDTHGGSYLKSQEGKLLPIEHCIFASEGWGVVKELDHANVCNHMFLKNDFAAIVGYLEYFCNCTMQGDVYCIKMKHNGLINMIDSDNDVDIELVGVCTDICVVSNALVLKAMLPEARISVDAQCCSGTTPENHVAALQVMRSCQINVVNRRMELR